jgi:hypothetical protein
MKLGTFKLGCTYKISLAYDKSLLIGSVVDVDRNWITVKDFKTQEETSIQLSHVVTYIYCGD